MASFTSEILCLYDLEAVFHKITMTHTSFEKRLLLLVFPFLNRKKKRKTSFIYGMKSENTL